MGGKISCVSGGAFGALGVLIIAALVIPQYSDYRAAAETSKWLATVYPLQRMVEENARKLKTLDGAGRNIALPKFSAVKPKLFEIRDNGEMILQGGRDGQMVMLTPSLKDGKVTWRCLGGPTRDVPCAQVPNR